MASFETFAVGDPISLVGLLGAPELNGRAGVVISELKEGRYGVKLAKRSTHEPAKALAAKPGASKSAIITDAIRHYIRHRGAHALNDAHHRGHVPPTAQARTQLTDENEKRVARPLFPSIDPDACELCAGCSLRPSVTSL